jgi:hypothetical protein
LTVTVAVTLSAVQPPIVTRAQ